MKYFTLSLAVLSLFLAATPERAFACSCVGFPTAEENYRSSYDRATMIFMGTVTDFTADEKSMRRTATFSVEKSWKGRPEAFVQIQTYGNSAMCGYDFIEGTAYVVFTQPDGEGNITTSLCSGTTDVKSEWGAGLIAWLNAYDGSGSSSSKNAWSCDPYICANGDIHPACTEDGHPINYFVAPCEFSGGEASGSSSSASTSAATLFTDVTATHANASAIAFVKEREIVSGYPDGSFGPDKQINRAEFTKIVIGATFGAEYMEGCDLDVPFKDVRTSDWFWPFVCQAKRSGVIDGYPDGTFGPGKNVNFAEAAKIVVNAFGIEIKEEEALGVWWRPYVYALARIGGLPPTFSDPNQLVTRGEMAEMISRVMQGLEE